MAGEKSYTPQPTELYAVWHGRVWRVMGWIIEDVNYGNLSEDRLVPTLTPVLVSDTGQWTEPLQQEMSIRRFGRVFFTREEAEKFNAENPEYMIEEEADY